MKPVKLLFLLAVMILGSCAPSIHTQLIKKYPPLDYKEEITVISLEVPVPPDAEILGVVRINDSGFTTDCSYPVVLKKAKREARKAGGNAIKITDHRLPNLLGSSCHRISAQILKINNPGTMISYRDTSSIPGADYALLHIYRFGGVGLLVSYDLHLGDSVIFRVKDRSKVTLKIKKDGMNTIWAKTEAKAEIPINIKLGKEYYIRCSMSMGTFVEHPEIELVDERTGKYEYESFKSK